MKRKADAPATKRDLQAHADATKKDLQALESSIRTDLQAFATKKDLQAHADATKKDLQALESSIRTDLQAFATKKDLEGFATKKDLERFATKDDLKPFAKQDDLDRLERVVKNMAVEVVGFKSALSGMRDDFSSILTRMESRLVDRIDGFMAKTGKVERDQFWLIRRMDKIEDRVSRIEKRSA